MSIKHLHRYLAETEYKYNHRRDTEAFAAVVAGLLIQAEIQYNALTGETSTGPSDDSSAPF